MKKKFKVGDRVFYVGIWKHIRDPGVVTGTEKREGRLILRVTLDRDKPYSSGWAWAEEFELDLLANSPLCKALE